jgi:glycosyltransferase involved in cell wall biosynthesis
MPLRLAMVTARYHPFTGGVETHVDEVAHRLARGGVDVRVLTTDVTGRLPAIEERRGVTIRRFRAYPRSRDYYLSPSLTRYLKNIDVDLVHVQGAHTLVAPLALRTAQRRRLPTVLTFHTGGHSNRLRHAGRSAQWKALQPILQRVGRLVCVSQFEVDLFSRLFGSLAARIRLIPNGAQPLPLGSRAGTVRLGQPLVVSVARLERYKGHQRLIAAMPELLRLASEAHLVIVGRGPYEAALHALAARLGVGHAVTITAFETDEREELGALLATADVVSLMSDYEAQPIAMLEALAMGATLVVADATGLAELARRGLATAVPVDAPPSELAVALLRAFRAPKLHLRRHVVLPTWDDCADALLAAYDELLTCGS